MTEPMPLAGTTFEFKSTSGGSYAAINNCAAKQIPSPEAVTEDITVLDSTSIQESNQIPDYGELTLEVLFSDADTTHVAMETSCATKGRNTAWIKVTHPSGYTQEFIGNAKSFKDKNGNARNNTRRDFKMHCNSIPTRVAPT